MNCPFCDQNIINKQRIYESDNFIVLYNLRPANKGQCLVVSKRHVNNIKELTDDELREIMRLVKKISLKLEDYLKPIGFNYGFNEGLYSGQAVEHFHFHILPRFEDDKNARLPQYHLFHRDPATKRNLTDEEIAPYVEEFKEILKNL